MSSQNRRNEEYCVLGSQIERVLSFIKCQFGYHDTYASGVIHTIAEDYELVILLVLRPWIKKIAAAGTPQDNPWLLSIGIFLIYISF